ncbi:MAG: hypothetical protein VX642_06555 [Bdellovibrionota bacterium]|nr:hypothetical protein [Bdellovibrionota bacterium]
MKKLISGLVIASLGLSSISLLAEEIKNSPSRPESIGEIIRKKSQADQPDLVEKTVQDYVVGRDKSRELFESRFKLEALKSLNDGILTAIETAKFENDLAAELGFTDVDQVLAFEITGNALGILTGVGLKGYQLRSFYRFLQNDPVLAAAMENYRVADGEYSKAYYDLIEKQQKKLMKENEIQDLKESIVEVEREGPIGALSNVDAEMDELNKATKEELSKLSNDISKSKSELKRAEARLSAAKAANTAMVEYTELNPNFLKETNSPYDLERINAIQTELKTAEKNLKEVNIKLTFLEERFSEVKETSELEKNKLARKRSAIELELKEKTKTFKNKIRGNENYISNTLNPEIESLEANLAEKKLARNKSKVFLTGTRLKKWTTRFLGRSVLGAATTVATVPLVIVSSNDLAENIQIAWNVSEDESVDLFAVNQLKNFLIKNSEELAVEIAEMEQLELDYYMQMSKKTKVYDLQD